MAKVPLIDGLVDPTKETDLVAGLASELRRPDDSDRPAGAPVIFFEAIENGEYLHYYASWDRFETVDPEVRCRVLMEAIRQVEGDEAALKSTIVLGLTPADARKLGFYLD